MLSSAQMHLGRKKPLQLTLGLSFLLAVIPASFYLGTRFGRYYERYSFVYSPPTKRNIQASFPRVFGLQRSHSQLGQDLWVHLATATGKRDGFHVDVGSAAGRWLSNTKLLDDMGWKEFASTRFRQTCRGERASCSPADIQRKRKKVIVRKAGMLGGIDSDLDKYKDTTSSAGTVELVTATLDEILA